MRRGGKYQGFHDGSSLLFIALGGLENDGKSSLMTGILRRRPLGFRHES
jgi:hypothetical protein